MKRQRRWGERDRILGPDSLKRDWRRRRKGGGQEGGKGKEPVKTG